MVPLGILKLVSIARFTPGRVSVENTPAASWNLSNDYLILAWIVEPKDGSYVQIALEFPARLILSSLREL